MGGLRLSSLEKRGRSCAPRCLASSPERATGNSAPHAPSMESIQIGLGVPRKSFSIPAMEPGQSLNILK